MESIRTKCWRNDSFDLIQQRRDEKRTIDDNVCITEIVINHCLSIDETFSIHSDVDHLFIDVRLKSNVI